LLRKAEVVVHDRLVSRAVLDGIPSHAALIDVGKAPECHRFPRTRSMRCWWIWRALVGVLCA